MIRGLTFFLVAYAAVTALHASDRADSVVIHVYPEDKLTKEHHYGQGTYVTSLAQLATEINRHYQKSPEQISVKIHAGYYYLTEPVTLQDLNGQTQIDIEPFGNERVVLSGSFRLQGVVRVTDPDVLNRLQVKSATDIYQVIIPEPFRDQIKITEQGQLFRVSEGEDPMRFASYPEKEDVWLYTGEVIRTGEKQVKVGYTAPGRISESPDDNIFLFGYWNRDWYGEHQRVLAWDPAHRLLTLPATSRYGYGKDHRFRFYNVLEQLDKPGEMYVDLKKGIIYFCSKNKAPEVFINANTNNLVIIRNSSYISMDRLMFRDTYAPAILIQDSRSVVLNASTIKNITTDAVVIRGGTNCGINDSEISNIGASCVILGGGDRADLIPSNHYVSQCNLHHFAQIQRVYKPAILLDGVGQSVRNSHIHHAPHQGIRITGNNHIIECNEFSNLALESGDVGAVYSGRDWTFRGNVIRNNFFHNLEGIGKLGAVAVYIDDLGSGFRITGNVFYKCSKAVQIGGGRDNTVDNNIFISCGTSVKLDNRGETTAKEQASPGGSWRMTDKLHAVPVRSETYTKTFPELASLQVNSPLSPLGNKVINNISTGSVFLDLKPNDPDYWKDILVGTDNITNPAVSLNQPVEDIVDDLNRYAGSRNKKFRPVTVSPPSPRMTFLLP